MNVSRHGLEGLVEAVVVLRIALPARHSWRVGLPLHFVSPVDWVLEQGGGLKHVRGEQIKARGCPCQRDAMLVQGLAVVMQEISDDGHMLRRRLGAARSVGADIQVLAGIDEASTCI